MGVSSVLRRTASVLAVVALVAWAVVTTSPSPSLATAGPTTSDGPFTIVQLRIEGSQSTIFEGPVRTKGHKVTTESGGTHHCDGTNNAANPEPGPTATSALDDGARLGGFTWDATYWAEYDEFFITRIASDAETGGRYWGILLNGEFTPVGGCQQLVELGDEVLFAYDAFTKGHVLRLTGPSSTVVGQPTNYHVSDAQTGAPIAAADVNGSASDANGDVTLTFGSPGTVTVKANRGDSIRSNGILTTVLA